MALLLSVLGFRVGPLPHRPPANSRRPGEGVLRPFLGETGGVGYLDLDVLSDPSEGLPNLAKVLSKTRLARTVGHRLRDTSRNSSSKKLESDGSRGNPARRDRSNRGRAGI